jgi:hypothetical protein
MSSQVTAVVARHFTSAIPNRSAMAFVNRLRGGRPGLGIGAIPASQLAHCQASALFITLVRMTKDFGLPWSLYSITKISTELTGYRSFLAHEIVIFAVRENSMNRLTIPKLMILLTFNVILSIRELFVCRGFSFHHANGVERMELLPRLLDKFDRLELLIAGLIGAVVASWCGIRWSMERLPRAPGGRSGGQCLCFAIAAQAQRVCRRQQRVHLFQLSGRHATKDGLCRP